MQILTLALTVCLMARVAYAQPTRVELDSALMKLMVAEAGWAAELDHVAMLFAIKRLDGQEARSSNLLETLNIHVGWWSQGYPPHRPWIADLNTSCNKPAGFPARLDWQRHQRWCISVVRRVRDHRAGKLKNPCKGRPNNWRARGRPSRKAKRIYYHVGCGRTLHNFFDTWRRPNGKATQTIRNRQRRDRLRRAASESHLPRPNRHPGRSRRSYAVLHEVRMRHARDDKS